MEDPTMKKVIFLLSLISFAFLAKASGGWDYAVVDGKFYYSQDVKVLINKISMKTDEGLTLLIPLNEVEAYKVNGKTFRRLPLVCRNGKVKCHTLLQLVGYKNGLTLYRYNRSDEDLGCCFEDVEGKMGVYFVYKNGELHSRVDEKTAWTIFPFFGIKPVSSRAEL
jgi:hypothetical protein